MSLPYTASCNPPRRAKRPRIDTHPPGSTTAPRDADDPPLSPAVALQPRPILPKRAASSGRPASGHGHFAPAATATAGSAAIPAPPSEASSASPASVTGHQPNKRGRKPGPLSRSAREAQRRLNHSIIEKARRTKINNALATLKQLVPLDYGRNPKDDNDSDDADDADDDDADYGREKKSKPRNSGKKEEKEREYKLEILVRTVAYMQDLLQRVAVLEQTTPTCSTCSTRTGAEQIKPKAGAGYEQTSSSDASDDLHQERTRRTKRPRTAGYNRQLVEAPPLPCPTSQEPVQETTLAKHRLPSISSWLPETLLDPSLFTVSPARSEHLRNKEAVPPLQLPTPPSSTHFNPLHSTTTTNAGSGTTSFTFPKSGNHRKTFSPTRTPEDESAASMLLQIRGTGSSPVFRPLPPSVLFLGPSSTVTPLPHPPLVAQGNPDAADAQTRARLTEGLAVQTPASLLGLVTASSST